MRRRLVDLNRLYLEHQASRLQAFPGDPPARGPDARRRLDEITDHAIAAFGPDEAHRFLNAENAVLGGRPSRVAAESDEGSILVDAEISRRRIKGESA